jgi:hypothetical protein
LARLAVAAARRAEMLEAVIAAADAAAAAHPPNAQRASHLPRGARRAATRLRPRDTRRDDAARARAVALAGLERARRVEAAVAAELANEALPLLEAEANPGGRPRKELVADLPQVSEDPDPKAAKW